MQEKKENGIPWSLLANPRPRTFTAKLRLCLIAEKRNWIIKIKDHRYRELTIRCFGKVHLPLVIVDMFHLVHVSLNHRRIVTFRKKLLRSERICLSLFKPRVPCFVFCQHQYHDYQLDTMLLSKKSILVFFVFNHLRNNIRITHI